MYAKLAVAAAAFGLVIAAGAAPSSAHHAFSAEFDAKRPVRFKGVVVKMEWINPHVWLHLDVKTPDGKVERWAFEAGGPNVLFRRGFTRESLLPGTVIVIDGYQAKDRSHRANGRDVTFEDGRKLFMGAATGAPYELDTSRGGTSKAPAKR